MTTCSDLFMHSHPCPDTAMHRRLYCALGCHGFAELQKNLSLYLVHLHCRDVVSQGTFLHAATTHDDLRPVEFLLNHGASSNVQDKYGWTPLHCALSRNSVQVVRQLVPFTELDLQTTACRFTPLHLVARETKDDASLVGLMLFYKASPLVQDSLGRTALHYSIVSKCFAVSALLIQHMGEWAIPDIAGDTPLLDAVDCNEQEIARQLVLVEERHWKLLPLLLPELLRPFFYPELIKIVLSYIATTSSLHFRNSGGETVLHRAAQCKSTVRALLMCSFLIEQGAYAEATDPQGRTYLERLPS